MAGNAGEANFLGFLRAALWPTLVLFILITARDPLKRILDAITNKLNSADEITIGQVAIRTQGGSVVVLADLKGLLIKLDSRTFLALINSDVGVHVYCTTSTSEGSEYEQHRKLSELHLFKVQEEKDIANTVTAPPIGENFCYSVEVTPERREARQKVLSFLSQLFRA